MAAVRHGVTAAGAKWDDDGDADDDGDDADDGDGDGLATVTLF